MSLFRSEEMVRCQIFLPTDGAYNCVSQLGELGIVQFLDMTPDVTQFQRKFVNEVRRADEMERKLRFLSAQLRKSNIRIIETNDPIPAPDIKEALVLDTELRHMERQMLESKKNEETLEKNYADLQQLKHVLRLTQRFFEEGHVVPSEAEIMAGEGWGVENGPQLAQEPRARQDVKLGFIAGIIRRNKSAVFEKLVWRFCHGNVLTKFIEVDETDRDLKDEEAKVVFIIFAQGERLKAKIKKICEGLKAPIYPIPEESQQRLDMTLKMLQSIEDLKTVLYQSQDYRQHVLHSIADKIYPWLVKVRKMKAIYHSLNLFNLDITERSLIGEAWIPAKDISSCQAALNQGTEASGGPVAPILQQLYTPETPPTYFRTNKFTAGFQNIVDAYGVASYREMNPAPYTIITFPFLFAVMFGDFGHGFIMFAFALGLIIKEKKLEAARIRDEIFQTFFGGRYIVLLMGIFAMYTGLIYNEVFSRSFNVFGSSWRNNYGAETLTRNDHLTLDPATKAHLGYPYPFGTDPVWQVAENALLFVNSFKMKMSVIMGIFQMIFGVVLSLLNHINFRSKISIFFEFLPQLVFLCSIFFYLCVIIFYKWTTFGAFPFGNYPGSSCAPSILIGLINMVMFTGREQLSKNSTAPNCATELYYPGQGQLEKFLVILAALCVPLMLLVKPIYLNSQNKKRAGIYAAHRSSAEELVPTQSSEVHSRDQNGSHPKAKSVAHSPVQHGGGHHDDESFGDLFVHQCIHTIEFCLGCISHTASYLRLWALSLAHSELTIVLWDMVMRMAFTIPGKAKWGCVVVYVIFAAFACLTTAILIVMEGLSAFLHALRLHWVEFNSKFYKGEGYPFVAFNFHTILEDARTADEAETSSASAQ